VRQKSVGRRFLRHRLDAEIGQRRLRLAGHQHLHDAAALEGCEGNGCPIQWLDSRDEDVGRDRSVGDQLDSSLEIRTPIEPGGNEAQFAPKEPEQIHL
jgi:hypothetical protein